MTTFSKLVGVSENTNDGAAYLLECNDPNGATFFQTIFSEMGIKLVCEFLDRIALNTKLCNSLLSTEPTDDEYEGLQQDTFYLIQYFPEMLKEVKELEELEKKKIHYL